MNSNLPRQLIRAEVFISQHCLSLYYSALCHNEACQTNMNEEGRDSERMFNMYKAITLGSSNSVYSVLGGFGGAL